MADRPAWRIAKLDLADQEGQHFSFERSNEIAIAINDLLEDNHFHPAVAHDGPYHVRLALEEGRLLFDIRSTEDAPLHAFMLALSPFRRPVRDYLAICDSYYEAIRHCSPSHIETIDMARRGLHEEGARLLTERLAGKADMDWSTARRLFTLICALSLRAV
ncbi:MAG TPA: UPF0262 family protein [Dongiaceae bacterium]|jgi:uncharacterized protein (UPF0262 family)|nr:UPF0262 family protein [Dongiaceae bacterium]